MPSVAGQPHLGRNGERQSCHVQDLPMGALGTGPRGLSFQQLPGWSLHVGSGQRGNAAVWLDSALRRGPHLSSSYH